MSALPGMPHLGTYRIITADPPWEHDNYGQAKHGAAKSAYDEMPLAVLKQMPVGELAHPEGALLFLWCTGPQAADGAHIALARAWGFRLTTRAFAWVKVADSCANCLHGWADHDASIDPPGFCDHPACEGCDTFAARPYFGPGSYTGGNVEDVWLGVRGDWPWSQRRARKDVRQVVLAPRARHSAKPEAVQDRIELLWPGVGPRLELFARRRRVGWAAWGAEAPGCDLVFGDTIGARWPLPKVIEEPAAIAPELPQRGLWDTRDRVTGDVR